MFSWRRFGKNKFHFWDPNDLQSHFYIRHQIFLVKTHHLSNQMTIFGLMIFFNKKLGKWSKLKNFVTIGLITNFCIGVHILIFFI